jgi:Sulfatase
VATKKSVKTKKSAVSESNEPAFPVHLDRNHLPEPEWNFPNAKIGMYATESTPDFPPTKKAREGAPNVLLVLLDDVGFGWPSVCGGLVRMPTAERLAKNGLFYNQFHTTALCSPTRAAMLTGRNHHTVATGVIQEMATGVDAGRKWTRVPTETLTSSRLIHSMWGAIL